MKSRLLGSMLMITGTAIGAGMLAMPLVTARLGFMLATLMLFVCWAVMTYTAFLILHINLTFAEGTNFSTMAIKTIGRLGQVITWCSLLLLLYALNAAYMTGGASLLVNSVSFISHGALLQAHTGVLLFMFIFGFFVYFGTSSVDYINRLLLTLKAVAFLAMVVFLFPDIRGQNLFVFPQVHLSWLTALPILITSFGFHIVIPSVRDYLHSDVKKLKRAILFGSLIPLLIYLLWEVIVLGIVPLAGNQSFATLFASGGGLSGLINQLNGNLRHPAFNFAVNFFTDLAVATSFLGVSMGLLHFIRDGFFLNKGRIYEKPVAALITFLPPLVFAWYYPQGFVIALNYASIFVVVLLIILPVMMALRLQRQHLQPVGFFINKFVAALLVIFGIITIFEQFIK